MNKLEERFEDILDNNIEFSVKPTGEDEWDYTDVFKKQAKESKDIAIDFAMYAREEWRRFHEEQKHGVEMSWIILWEKFINQRY